MSSIHSLLLSEENNDSLLSETAHLKRPQVQSKPKILFIGSFIDQQKRKERGGMLAACTYLVNSSIKEKVEFITFDTTNQSIPIPSLSVRIIGASKRLIRLFRILRSSSPDLALIYSSSGLSFLEKGLLVIILKMFSLPVIWSIRSGAFMEQARQSRIFSITARLLLRFPDIILGQGKTWSRFYEQELGINPIKVRHLPNWIEPSKFLEFPERTLKDFSSSPFNLLFVGWVNRTKGIFELLQVLSKIQTSTKINLNILGMGEDFIEAVQYSKDNANPRVKIIFHEWLSGEPLLRHFQSADTLVLPSYAEGFPNVILEAMASALPIITTPVGSIADVIIDGENGILVDPKNCEQLKNAILKLIKNPQLCLDIGRRNREDIISNHTIDKLSNDMWQMMTNLLDR